jgi:hypothetical protein
MESILPSPGTASPRLTLQMPLGPSTAAKPFVTSRTVHPLMVVGLVSGTGVSFVRLSASFPFGRIKSGGPCARVATSLEITRLAEAHLREHAAELLAQAEASGAVQKLRVAHARRAVEAQGKSLNETLVQNGDQQ